MCAHEALHLAHALKLYARCDVDEDQRPSHVGPTARLSLALCKQAGDSPERCADEHWGPPMMPPEFGGNRSHIGREILKRIAAVSRPLRVAMPALVERVRGP